MNQSYDTYTVAQNRTNSDFVKEVLDILIKMETPGDIFDKGDFAPVENGVASAFVAYGNAETAYSFQGGRNRQEEYWGKGFDGKPAKKTRTVTDWEPVSGTHFYNGWGAAITREEPGDYIFSPDLVSDCEPFNYEDSEPIAVDDEDYALAKESLIDNAEDSADTDCVRGYDKYKDTSFSSVCNVDEYKQYIIPTQRIKFNYDSREYYLASFAREGGTIDKRIPTISANMDETVKEMMNFKRRRPLVVNIFAGILCVVLCVILTAIMEDSMVLPALLIFATVAFQFIYFKLFEAKKAEIRRNLVETLREQKRKSAEKILSKYNCK